MATTVVILGSPRNGNSDAIANAMAAEAKAKGNTVKTFKLNDLKNAKGCQSCYGCKAKGRCVVKDDIGDVLDAIRDADSLVLATPTYFGYSTAQYRMLEDRFFSFIDGKFVPNIPAGKKVAVIETCGGGLDGAKANADRIVGQWEGMFKAKIVGVIVKGYGPDKSAADDKEVIAEAKEIGKKL